MECQIELTNEKKIESNEETIKSAERQKIVNYVRKWGSETTDAVLDPSCLYFMTPGIEGLIGYRIEGKCAVAFGDPVASSDNKGPLALAFQQYCRSKGFETIYVVVSKEFAEWATNNICRVSLEFGEKLVLDPQNNPKNNTGTHGSLVRRKVRRTQKEGTVALEYTSDDPAIESAIERVGQEWLKKREGPQIHISHVRLFEDRAGKRWFYAQKDNKIVGIVLLNELQAKNGWLLNHLMITADAPKGTPELLVMTALEAIEKEGCHFVTFGPAPLENLQEMHGLDFVSAWLARMGFKLARRFFKFDGYKTFWGKFNPQSEQSFLLFSRLNIGTIRSLLQAMNASF